MKKNRRPGSGCVPVPRSGYGCASAEGSVYYLNFKPEQDAQWQELAKIYTEQTGVPVTVNRCFRQITKRR